MMEWPHDAILGSRRPCNHLSDSRSKYVEQAKQLSDPPPPHTAVQFPYTMTQLFMHIVKHGATHLLFTAKIHSVLQMLSTNCGNDNRILEIENENDNTTALLLLPPFFGSLNLVQDYHDNWFVEYCFTFLIQTKVTTVATVNEPWWNFLSKSSLGKL